MIERKDVGGGENWGILEVTESKEGIFLNQIRRGQFNVKIGMVIMWEDCCGGGSIAVLCGAHNKNQKNIVCLIFSCISFDFTTIEFIQNCLRKSDIVGSINTAYMSYII